MQHVTVSVVDHVELMLEAPSRLLIRARNDVARHHVPLDDPDALVQELYGLLSDEPSVDWLFFGNEAGGVVSTGVLDDGQRVIMLTDGFKAGPINQYSATPDGRIADLLKSGSDFDARTKDWYRSVEETRKPFLTKPYLGSIEPVLGVSLSVPVVDGTGELIGVYGIDLILTSLTEFMARLQLGDTGRAYLVDSDGYLVASSGGVQPVIKNGTGVQQRMLPQDTPDPVVSAAGRYLHQHPKIMARAREGSMQYASFDDAALGKIAVAVQEVPIANSSPWFIVSALPASDFLGPVHRASYLSLALVAVIVLASMIVGFWMVGKALRPLHDLTTVAHAIADGAWPAVPETKRDDEIGVLARSLDNMTGKLRKLLGVLEQRVSELYQSRSLLQSILDNSSALISVKDPEGRYLLANRRYEELLHVSAEEMRGKTDDAMFPRELSAALGAADGRAFAAGTAIEVEVVVPQDDGPHKYIALKYPLVDAAGEPYAVCGIATDITERLQAEADREARFLAEEASRAKSAFLASMSHELRTPLNAVLGYAQILKRDRNLNERQVHGLNTIQQSGEHLLALITDLLDMAKIEAGRLELYPAPVSLPRLLREVSDIIRIRAEQRGLLFLCETAPGLPEAVVLDEKRLRQVLLNLLSNAVKFTERGTVSLRVRHLAEGEGQVRLVFAVEDSGVGIRRDHLETIFQPFEQVGAAENRAEGTGLGLAISRQLIRAMGGDIEVSSQPGVGSLFSFEVVTSTTNVEIATSPAGHRIIGYRGSRRRVLIVDDIVANRSVLAALLTELGFEISEAEDGREGLARAQATRPDLILMDLRMAGMNGFDAIRRMRQTPELQKVPIIAVSSSAQDEGLAHSLKVGADAFLTKPIDQDKLTQLIGTYLSLDWLTEAPQTPPVTNDDTAARLVAPPQEEMAAPRELTAPERPLDGVRVLVVEDNEINRAVAAEMLRLAGAEVTLAKNGAEAVERVGAETFDVVLMDIQMPIMDGYEATRRIREDPRNADLPILATTAEVLPEQRAKCLEVGVNEHLAKPLDAAVLEEAVARWALRERPGRQAPERAPSSGGPQPDLSGFNTARALARLDSNESLLRRLRDQFCRNHRGAAAEVRAAWEKGDFNRVRLLAHTMKGSASAIGADALASAAAALEDASRESPSPRDVARLNALERALGDVLERLTKA